MCGHVEIILKKLITCNARNCGIVIRDTLIGVRMMYVASPKHQVWLCLKYMKAYFSPTLEESTKDPSSSLGMIFII